LPAPLRPGAPDCTRLDLPVARTEPPPSQYADFCAREPGACALSGAAVLPWTPELQTALSGVNRAVNARVALVPDADRGQEERWDFPVGCEGDCEDFALEKRRILVAAGLPSAALTMAIVHHRTRFFPHAVLLAETTAGTFVLDDLRDEPACWSATPYRFERRERPDGSWDRYMPV
jgi:predicted transglutaminase-like cysteine proteinase